jgi:hypothetical protein
MCDLFIELASRGSQDDRSPLTDGWILCGGVGQFLEQSQLGPGEKHFGSITRHLGLQSQGTS